jgi:hypothetical protein
LSANDGACNENWVSTTTASLKETAASGETALRGENNLGEVRGLIAETLSEVRAGLGVHVLLKQRVYACAGVRGGQSAGQLETLQEKK